MATTGGALKATKAAAYCGVSRSTFYQLVAPRVRHVQLVPGGDRLYLVADLDALLLGRVVYTPVEQQKPAAGTRRARQGRGQAPRPALDPSMAEAAVAVKGVQL